MSIHKRLQDFPDWAIPLVYLVVGALLFSHGKKLALLALLS